MWQRLEVKICDVLGKIHDDMQSCRVGALRPWSGQSESVLREMQSVVEHACVHGSCSVRAWRLQMIKEPLDLEAFLDTRKSSRTAGSIELVHALRLDCALRKLPYRLHREQIGGKLWAFFFSGFFFRGICV